MNFNHMGLQTFYYLRVAETMARSELPHKQNMIKTYPYIVVLIRFIVGVFIVASYDKILDPGNFAREISNYHFIPFG